MKRDPRTNKEIKSEITKIRSSIQKLRSSTDDNVLMNVSNENSVESEQLQLKQRRLLKGHFGKIYAMHWGADSKHLVSASQDGKLIVWNGFTTNKVHAIPLRSSWVMTCAYSPSGMLVACGGLDNLCSIYKIAQKNEGLETKVTYRELAQHEGYLSCCRFIDDQQIITASGDRTCILWNLETKTPYCTFTDHAGDVMSVSIIDKRGIFVSGSCDATSKIFDYRVGKAVSTFPGHQSDINSVDFFPDGQCFGTGSDDASCRLFDMRSYRQLNEYIQDYVLCGITSVTFSQSGKYLFAGYDDYICRCWNTLTTSISDTLKDHENRVSCVGMSKNGQALCTGSWDTVLKIWA